MNCIRLIFDNICKVLIFIYISICFAYLFSDNGLGSEIHLNYEAGYIRRGLIGEIFFLLVKYFNFDINYLIVTFSILIKISVISFIGYLIYKKKIPFFLIFSPPLLLAGFYYSISRFDFFLLLIFLVHIFTFNSFKSLIFYCLWGG